MTELNWTIIFSCTYGPSVCLLWKKSIFISSAYFLIGLFVLLLLSCMRYLQSQRLICRLLSLQIFSLILGVVFLFYGFLCCAKAFKFDRSHLFIFVIIFITLGGGSKKILLWFMSKSTPLMFSFKSFIVSDLLSRSLIHFEFIFVCGIKECWPADEVLPHHWWLRAGPEVSGVSSVGSVLSER